MPAMVRIIMKTNRLPTALSLLGACLLSACAARTLPPVQADQSLDAKRYQIKLVAHDGVELGVTVWQPNLAAGESAPLVMHSHGFGLQRMDGRFGMYENLLPSGQIAKQLWQQGFWLITWDQRGHGDSGGEIDVMNPDLEVRDVSTLLDWAEKNISRLARDDDGDIRVGMVGESYGGGVQMLATVQEPRIDALVPMTTWYDLDSALSPHDVPKGGWIKTLYLMGDWWNFRKLNPSVRESFHQARRGVITEDFRQNYANHSLKYFCDKGQLPQADALLIQGLRDMLFDVQQTLNASECFRQAGRDVNVIVQEGGHLLPMSQSSPSWPVWYLDKTLHCMDKPMATQEVAVHWLQSKLDGGDRAEIEQNLPPICLSASEWGASLAHWPVAQDRIELAPVKLKGASSGSWRWITATGDWFSGWRGEAALAKKFSAPRESGLRPAFIPLYSASGQEKRFGTPSITLTRAEAGASEAAENVSVENQSAEFDHQARVLVGLVVRRAGKSSLQIVDDQITPAPFNQPVDLAPVALSLEAGDQLGVVLFSRDRQFNTTEIDFADGVEVSGSIKIPATLTHIRSVGGIVLPTPSAPALSEGVASTRSIDTEIQQVSADSIVSKKSNTHAQESVSP
jgi:ABC-2 type transport system ATP-binding protein